MINIIVGVAFGVRSDGPGKSNEAIGKLVEKYAERENVPVIAQEEVVLTLLDELGNEVEIIQGNLPWKNTDNYGDTHDIAVKARKIADRNDWKDSIILVCHPAHAWRTKRIFRRQSFNITMPPRQELIEIPYDSKSYQPWTRNKYIWWLKELIYSIPLDKARGYY